MAPARARTSPAILWLELTSKCPLRCIFCSRENLRGEGEHMSISLVESILNSLDSPEIVRLNYSGESGNYPWLIEAIRLVKSMTDAQTEMVTSLVSMPLDSVRALAHSGIDRISISLHTLENAKFPVIYGGGGLDSFERRLALLAETAQKTPRPPMIDFAAVAMESNVSELPAIASFASNNGAPLLSIHPVICRGATPASFHAEVAEDGALTDAFQGRLDAAVRAARDLNPSMSISVARPRSPAGTGPFTCEQNPFETTHILAGGEVVACEVLDRASLGSLHTATLAAIWNGPAYSDFRDRYATGAVPECANCIFRSPVPKAGAVDALWGWHERDETGTLWSRPATGFECEASGHNTLTLTGVLPSDPRTNALRFYRDGQEVGLVRNDSAEALPFQVQLPLPVSTSIHRFVAQVDHGCSPWRRGTSNDSRELGFALFTAELCNRSVEDCGARIPAVSRPVRLRAQLASLLLTNAAPHPRNPTPPHHSTPNLPDDSMAIIIPERGGSPELRSCLAALTDALAQVSIPHSVILVVNGSDARDYKELAAEFRAFRFHFVPRPLGFTAAVRAGLGSCRGRLDLSAQQRCLCPRRHVRRTDSTSRPGHLLACIPNSDERRSRSKRNQPNCH